MHRNFRKTTSKSGESGQSILLVVLVLGIVLLGAVAFSVDMGNMWFHRQSAQTAADAACTAGAMDLLVDATNGITTQGGFTATINTSFDCSATSIPPTSGATPCQYAALNGYNSSNSSPGNLVNVSFPSAVSGLPTTSASFPPAALAPVPFIRVDVLDRVQTYFSGLLSGAKFQPVRAFAVCGLVNANSPIPIIVLNPTASSALQVSGNPIISILGGANRSIQVNSNSPTAVSISGSGAVDLRCGGSSYTGSVLGVFGGPGTQTNASGNCPGTPIPSTFPPSTDTGFHPGATGAYQSPSSPISDPFARIAKPTCTTACPPVVPSDLTIGPTGNSCVKQNPNACTGLPCTSSNIQNGICFVSHNTHGCPDPGAATPPLPKNGCQLYTAGYYPNGITVDGGGGLNAVAVFDPGVYYLNGGLGLKQGSVVRPGTGTGDGSHGTVFYLTGSAQTCSGQTGLVCVGANSGKSGLDNFTTSAAQCPSGTPTDPKLGVPATLSGNVLLAPCTGTYGDPAGKVRGILFFADRATATGGGWGGGGGFLLAGSMYFHQCKADGTGTSCPLPPTGYNKVFELQGNSGSASYILGEIIADQLHMQGNPTINMALNPSAVYTVLKATLLR